MTSIALAGVIGNPLSGTILQNMKDVAGLKGWQWLFLLEGIPTILLGISVYFYFTDKPKNAKWLEPEERDWLESHLESERAATRSGHDTHHLMHAFKSGRVWLLSFIYGSIMMGFYHLNYWTPTIVKNMQLRVNGDVSESYIGRLSAIPFIAAVIGMVVIGRIADWTGNRRTTLIGSALFGCVGLLAASQTTTTATTIAAMSVAAIGIFGSLAPFWTLPSAFLTGTAAAAGIALINSLGNLAGGFAGNKLRGYLMETYHTHTYGMMIDAGVLLVGVMAILCLTLNPSKNEVKPVHD
jgi:sugar phosphate permease